MSQARRLKGFKVRKPYYILTTFALALLVGIAVIGPMIFVGRGVFYYYGDFNVQEIPFYQLLHACVRSGDMSWNHITDLGSDTLASYSFYTLGSPFFWMTIPFPNSFVPNLIGPLLILKFACAAASAHIYLQRHVSRPIYAVLGGLLYAFSSFSVYNIFFFHFHEPMIVFPLLLAALDAFLFDKRRGLFAVAVFAAAAINYYFFTGQALFVFMYFLMLSFTKTYKFKFKEFLLLALETVIGFLAAAFILLPSVLGIMGNPRLNEVPNSWNMLVHNPAQRYGLIVCAFLFPSDLPAWPVFTPESNCKWASVAAWLPLFGMTGTIAFLQLRKRDWLKKMITLLFLFALVPVLNSAFQLFNTTIFYARWYYMLVLMLVLATIRALESSEANWGRAIAWSSGLVFGAAMLIGLMPAEIKKDGNSKASGISFGVEAHLERFWIIALFSIICILGFALIYKKFNGRKWAFPIALISAVLAVSVTSSLFVVATGVFDSNSSNIIKKDIMNSRDKITIDDLDEVRSDFYECVDNTPMFWRVQSINCFQSSVSPSILTFYNKLGIVRDVASRPDFSAFPLRAFLSCKYYFDHTSDNENAADSDVCFIDKKGETKMPYWSFVKNCNNFDIYENECYIPMGFAYDTYITQKEFGKIDKKLQCEALLKGLVLSREQMKKYSDITGYTDEQDKKLYGEDSDNYKEVSAKYKYGWEEYKNDCTELADNCCSRFEYTKDGFRAQFNNKKDDTLLFFSVPYSEGFSAKVNGEPVDVEKVDYGFMAVRVPGKTECDVVFTYETPGWNTGVKISLAALAVFAVYLAAVVIYRRKRRSAARKHAA
ncbi:MAG: YfhO family protein [Ruminococcus sp.]|nr:YfhO family protein [Ruminococcus sp.]